MKGILSGGQDEVLTQKNRWDSAITWPLAIRYNTTEAQDHIPITEFQHYGRNPGNHIKWQIPHSIPIDKAM